MKLTETNFPDLKTAKPEKILVSYEWKWICKVRLIISDVKRLFVGFLFYV